MRLVIESLTRDSCALVVIKPEERMRKRKLVESSSSIPFFRLCEGRGRLRHLLLHKLIRIWDFHELCKPPWPRTTTSSLVDFVRWVARHELPSRSKLSELVKNENKDFLAETRSHKWAWRMACGGLLLRDREKLFVVLTSKARRAGRREIILPRLLWGGAAAERTFFFVSKTHIEASERTRLN